MVPEKVMQAGALPMINHRSEEFELTLRSTLDNLKTIYGTKDNVFVLAGSGRTGVEAALINSMSPGDRVLVGINGNFGEMMATICKEMGYDVVPVWPDWNRPIDPQAVEDALKKDGAIKTVAVVHNETSTGTVNDIRTLADVAHRHDCIIVVDGVSSVGGMPINMDEWGIDMCATGSQKCLMSPPGLGIVGVRQAAWERVNKAKSPRYYMDFRRFKEPADKPMPQTPGTTSVSLVRCLDEACKMIVCEGTEKVYARHVKLAAATRLGITALGLPLVPPEPAQSSPTLVTAGIQNSGAFLDMVMKEHNLHIGRGLGKWAKDTFRIGVMGEAARPEHILRTLELMGEALAKHGLTKTPADAGVKAAKACLAK